MSSPTNVPYEEQDFDKIQYPEERDVEEEKEEIYPDEAEVPDEGLIRELSIHGSSFVW